MGQQRRHCRLLIYSHDSFGLGHLRRCRAIAQALVRHRHGLTVLILSGSPIIGSFSFSNRVDFVRIPGVIKLRHGDYTALSLDMGIEEILAMRAAIIRHTAQAFRPSIFLVDKEPLGLRGEVRDTLTMLKSQGSLLVLGLRDVMDEPVQLAEEWERKNAVSALNDLYDNIWIYGLPQICNALEGIPLPASTLAKVQYTGYLRRTLPAHAQHAVTAGDPYILVTTGGGGDGAALIDWVLRAYECDTTIPHRALLVLGPFMRSTLQHGFMERVARLPRVEAITFEAEMESLMNAAAGVVAMGGYNTFCEILSFDKPALIVPREEPRLEQFIRAQRAEALGLIRMASAKGDRSPRRMAKALHELPGQPRPSQIPIPGLLDGLSVIASRVDEWLDHPAQRLSVISGLT